MWLLLMIASTPCSSRSSEGAADVVSALNARFRAGRPSDDPASAGVVVHAIDNRDQARGLALIWRPNTRMGQIVSCSLMNAELPFIYAGGGVQSSEFETAPIRGRAIVVGGQARLAVQLSMGRLERHLIMPQQLALVGHVRAGLPIRG